jgi:hypothetical protein
MHIPGSVYVGKGKPDEPDRICRGPNDIRGRVTG